MVETVVELVEEAGNGCDTSSNGVADAPAVRPGNDMLRAQARVPSQGAQASHLITCQCQPVMPAAAGLDVCRAASIQRL